MDKQLNELLKRTKKSDYNSVNKDRKSYKKTNQPIITNPYHKYNIKTSSKNGLKLKEKQFYQAQLSIKGTTKREVRENYIRGITNIIMTKYKSTEKQYNLTIIESLICNKNCHAVAILKDFMIIDYIDEFLKRFYVTKESKERVPKIANYYKNYLKFFCHPVFMNFEVNSIIHGYGDCKAELYYKNNYGEKGKRPNKLLNKMSEKEKLFSTTVKENIDNDSLTKTEININQSGIVKETKGNIDELGINEVSQFSSKSGLATRRSKEDSFISNLLTNLNTNKNSNIDIFYDMTRNKPKIIQQLNSNNQRVISEKKPILKKNEGNFTNNKKEYKMNQIQIFIKDMEIKTKNFDQIKIRTNTLSSNSSNLKSIKGTPNVASNRIPSSSTPNEEKMTVKSTINLAKKETINDKKLSTAEIEVNDVKESKKNLVLVTNHLNSQIKSPINSNQTRITEINIIKDTKQMSKTPNALVANHTKPILSSEHDLITVNKKSNLLLSHTNTINNHNHYINLKQSKVGSTNQNDSKPKNIKSIDLKANTNPTITLDLKYSIASRNSAKSPETKTPGREKSADSKIERNTTNLALDSLTRTSFKNNYIFNNVAQVRGDKPNLNNFMKITLSQRVDGKSRPTSSNMKKETNHNKVNNYPGGKNIESKLIKDNKNDNINNFNININNQNYRPTSFEPSKSTKSEKEKLLITKPSNINNKILTRNKQLTNNIKAQSKDTEVKDYIRTDVDFMYSSLNIHKKTDTKDYKSKSTNIRQLNDVLKNLPEYMTYYKEDKKPHSNIKVIPEVNAIRSKLSFPHKTTNDKESNWAKSNNNITKSKTIGNTGCDSKKTTVSSGKTSKVLTGVQSSDKKVFQKIK